MIAGIYLNLDTIQRVDKKIQTVLVNSFFLCVNYFALMFGLVNRTRFERVSNDSGVSSRKTSSPPPEEEEMDEETYERRARLCHSKYLLNALVVSCR